MTRLHQSQLYQSFNFILAEISFLGSVVPWQSCKMPELGGEILSAGVITDGDANVPEK